MIQCRPCGLYSNSSDVPTTFLKQRRGHFGIFEKFTNQGDKRKKFHITEALYNHTSSDLHKWCVQQERKSEFEKRNWEERNIDAGRIVIRNAIKVLKHGQSSVDFLADNNLFNLESSHQTFNVPSKNDSSDAFFKLREVIYEVVTEKIKNWFAIEGKGEIDDISVTLDKVTVFGVSYTALLTYFFHHGRIYVILNKLMLMKEDEYDGEGTARAVVDALVETLGVTKSRLADIL